MTLLTEKDLEESTRALSRLESFCSSACGMTPYELGCRAFGLSPVPLSDRQALRVACIPITAGIGILGDFCHIVAAAIGQLCGASAFVTQGCDVTGFEEALEGGADIVFMADDDTFVAYQVKSGRFSDNSCATGRMFAALLDCASGGIDGDVLILGVGKVGAGACRYLSEQGISAKWFDVKEAAPACFDAARKDPEWGKRSWPYLIDATTAAGIIDVQHVTSESIVSAPGVPFGVTPGAQKTARLVIHDNLALGVVAMFCQAAAG